MKKLFYGMAIILAIVLIVLGVMASRKTPKPTDTSNTDDSFNADQLQDAAGKTPTN